MKLILKIFPLFLIAISSYGQLNEIAFIENKGQWNAKVRFKARIPGGNLYAEQNELTYLFYDEDDIIRFHDLHHNPSKVVKPEDMFIDLHSYKMSFVGAYTEDIVPSNPSKDYHNYFIGDDREKWASHVRKFDEIKYKELYKNVGLKFYLKDNHLKYDFIVMPGGDVDQIKWQYTGLKDIFLEKGELHLVTSINKVVEAKPYAYQNINGKEKAVKCKFILEDGMVSFEFPRGYNMEHPLIIDPTLVFASYSGSTEDNWGYTSTFDDAGNLYGGGVTFGFGYPTTIGAFQTNFNGGTFFFGCDISITKFSPDGVSAVYATYLGGSDNEAPHSLIVNHNDELLIMGTSSSMDFPFTLNSYDSTFNGGVPYFANIPNYTNGSDIIVSKLSTDGSVLLGSTYVGGGANDGLNEADTLQYNYADDYRGEIIIDDEDNVYIASSTLSNNFPTTANAFQASLSGQQDGCIFKLNSELDSLIWSSYIGGTGNDAAYSLQLSGSNDILTTGGTVSSDFPVTPGALQTTYQSGGDAWIAKVDSAATTISACTFLGTTEYDQSFFVQLDSANNVYVVGQTEGTYPIFPTNVYNIANSGQFLHKLNPDLTSTIFSTTIGTGSGEVDIALSAFLVNECNYIFISGWGGVVNVFNGGAAFSTTTGLPITPGAIQPTTDGNDYYLMMLSEDADTLLYSTFFGGNQSGDHVDGGTSRFDKRGIVYQAVCASCGNFAVNDFPTTPGVVSTTNNSTNCNLGVFKMDLTILSAGADVYTTPFHCTGDTVDFQNLSNGGVSYYWDFGDGDTSSLFEPSHVYDSIGTYRVMLVSLDSISCLLQDTDFVDVFIGGPPSVLINPINGICLGDSIQLTVTSGTSYSWTPNYNIDDTTVVSPTVWPDSTTTYSVIVMDSCGVDTAEVLVEVFQKNIGIDPDTMICLGQSVQINASGGTSYQWNPGASLSDPSISGPVSTPIVNTTYNVEITDLNNCIWDTMMTVLVDDLFPIAVAMVTDDTICPGDSTIIYAQGGEAYSWSPSINMVAPGDSSTVVFPLGTTSYIVEVSNGCGVDHDTVDVNIHVVDMDIIPDTGVCIGNEINLWAAGGSSYSWYSSLGTHGVGDTITEVVTDPLEFFVDITDEQNCSATLSVFVDTIHPPSLEIGPDIGVKWGDQIRLTPSTTGINFWWEPTDGLSCSTCPNPVVTGTETITYFLTVQGPQGCFNTDTITIVFDGSIYVPNTFSPDGDGINDVFYVLGKDIVDFELFIFDRWGERLFYSDNIEIGWNGKYKGDIVKTETYVWKLKYKDVIDNKGTLYGTVTVIK